MAAELVVAALRETKGDTDGKKLAAAIKGRTIKSIFGTKGTVTMRAEDHTLVDYIIGFGVSSPKEPFINGFGAADWGPIVELEKQWKKKQGYA